MTKQNQKADDQVDDQVDDQIEDDDDSTEHDESFKPIKSQERLNAIVQNRLSRAKASIRRELQDEIRNELKSEFEAESQRKADEESGQYKKLYEDAQREIDELKSNAEKEKLNNLKITLLEGKGLPASAAKRIFGTTEDEIKADIDEYLKDTPVKKAPKESPATGDTTKPKKDGQSSTEKKDYNSAALWGLPNLKTQ